ncbi:MAG: hypothetical protein ACRD3N_02485 [Terracidiphilus sp.]
MSTKSSIRYEFDDASQVGFHLYEEAFDEGNVYLELDGFHFEASSLPDITYDKGNLRVVIRFPSEWAKRLKLIDAE